MLSALLTLIFIAFLQHFQCPQCFFSRAANAVFFIYLLAHTVDGDDDVRHSGSNQFLCRLLCQQHAVGANIGLGKGRAMGDDFEDILEQFDVTRLEAFMVLLNSGIIDIEHFKEIYYV